MSNHSEAVEDIKKAKAALENPSGGFSYESVKNAGLPDPRKHLYISLVKSFIRIGAGVALVIYGLPIVGGLLIAAEVLGIAEELV